MLQLFTDEILHCIAELRKLLQTNVEKRGKEKMGNRESFPIMSDV